MHALGFMVKHVCYTHRSAPPPPGVSLKKVGFSELLCKPSGRHERNAAQPGGDGNAISGHGHRHVRTTVAMELTTALHHSAQWVWRRREREWRARSTTRHGDRSLHGASCGGGRAAGKTGSTVASAVSSFWPGTAGGRFCAGFPRGCGREGPGGVVHGAGPFWLLHVPGL